MCGQRIEDSNEFHIQRQCRTAGAPFRRRFHSLRSRCAPIKNNFNWRIMLLKAASCSPLYRLPSHQSPASRSLQKISSLHGPCSTVHGKHQNIFRFTFVQFPVDFFIRHESALLFTDIKSWLGRHFLRFAFYFYRLQFDFFFVSKKEEEKSTLKSHYAVLLFVLLPFECRHRKWHGTRIHSVFRAGEVRWENRRLLNGSKVHVTARYTYLRFCVSISIDTVTTVRH